MSEGTKFDAGKSRMDLIEPDFLEELGYVLGMGAAKYGVQNWQKDLSVDRIYAALLRHLMAYKRGEVIDDESTRSHLIHAAANIMFLYYYQQQLLPQWADVYPNKPEK